MSTKNLDNDLFHGTIAPSFILKVSSVTINSSSKKASFPIPSHFGQAPNGLLKENIRGSISSNLKPETGHYYFSDKVILSPFLYEAFVPSGNSTISI